MFENMKPYSENFSLIKWMFMEHICLSKPMMTKRNKPSKPLWMPFWKEWHVPKNSLRQVLQRVFQKEILLSQEMTASQELLTLKIFQWGSVEVETVILMFLILWRPNVCVLCHSFWQKSLKVIKKNKDIKKKIFCTAAQCICVLICVII